MLSTRMVHLRRSMSRRAGGPRSSGDRLRVGANLSEGVAMKRFAKTILCAVLCLGLCGQQAMAWGSLGYGGYQPWWNIFAKRNKCQSCEEERLQRFWHDY